MPIPHNAHNQPPNTGIPPIYGIYFRPHDFSANSGMEPVARSLNMKILDFSPTWSAWQRKSWRAGNWLRQWGIRYYGSAWNALAPHWDEMRFLRSLPTSTRPYPVHFLFGEFAAPKRVEPYHRKGAKVVVSLHCSARRWNNVWLKPNAFSQADRVILTSQSQRPFVAPYLPPERIQRIFHGVDLSFFAPAHVRPHTPHKLRLLLLGNTERDHPFAAQIARHLPPERFEWRVRTASHEKSCYENIAPIHLLPHLSEPDMLREYQCADLLCMPMLDSAANNVFLQSMACGTPVMTNRVGGVPEYIRDDCNFIMSNNHNPTEWIEKLLWLEKNRDALEKMRPATRQWAEHFDWNLIANEYRAMYAKLLNEP